MRKLLLALFPHSAPRTRISRSLWLRVAYWAADLSDWVGVRAEAAIIELERLP